MLIDPVSMWGYLLMSIFALINAICLSAGRFSMFASVGFWVIAAATFAWGWFMMRLLREGAEDPEEEQAQDNDKKDGEDKDAKG